MRTASRQNRHTVLILAGFLECDTAYIWRQRHASATSKTMALGLCYMQVSLAHPCVRRWFGISGCSLTSRQTWEMRLGVGL
jgi:hypothetical protein